MIVYNDNFLRLLLNSTNIILTQLLIFLLWNLHAKKTAKGKMAVLQGFYTLFFLTLKLSEISNQF